jgi:hypothetical protein
MNWKIELRCDELDLEYLLNDLQTNGLLVIYKDNKPFLKSDTFSAVNDYGELKNKAIELLDIASPIASF